MATFLTAAGLVLLLLDLCIVIVTQIHREGRPLATSLILVMILLFLGGIFLAGMGIALRKQFK